MLALRVGPAGFFSAAAAAKELLGASYGEATGAVAEGAEREELIYCCTGGAPAPHLVLIFSSMGLTVF